MSYRPYEDVAHLMSREVYDDSLEFLKLIDPVLEANLLATLNTSNIGLHIYAGTPPKPDVNVEGDVNVNPQVEGETSPGDIEPAEAEAEAPADESE